MTKAEKLAIRNEEKEDAAASESSDLEESAITDAPESRVVEVHEESSLDSKYIKIKKLRELHDNLSAETIQIIDILNANKRTEEE